MIAATHLPHHHPTHSKCWNKPPAALSQVGVHALPSLLLHQDFLFPQQDLGVHLLLVGRRGLWAQVDLVDPEGKRRHFRQAPWKKHIHQ